MVSPGGLDLAAVGVELMGHWSGDRRWLLAAGCAALAVVSVLAVGASAAVSAVATVVISIDSGTVASGEDVELGLRVEGVPPPGLGAVTASVSYDSQIVDAVGCSADPAQALEMAVCNLDFEHDGAGRDAVRLTGVHVAGAVGDLVLATVRFRGKDLGTTSLELTLDTFSDPSGQPMAAEAADGELEVTGGAAVATATPASEAAGPAGGDSGNGWGRAALIVGLVGGALLLLLLAGAAVRQRLRRRYGG